MKNLLFACSVVITTSANAHFLNGNDLLLKLNQSDITIAQAYVAGVFDAYQGAVHCAPASVSLTQATDMTRAYLTNDPTNRNRPADELIGRMLATVWPCQAKKESGVSL